MSTVWTQWILALQADSLPSESLRKSSKYYHWDLNFRSPTLSCDLEKPPILLQGIWDIGNHVSAVWKLKENTETGCCLSCYTQQPPSSFQTEQLVFQYG